MVLPIGFFAPLPLPMMIPFMGIQSAVMAEQFGTMFQYGKRRISAMSNEEFNKLTFDDLQKRMTTQLEGMIPEMKQQIQAMSELVPIIIREFVQYISLATKELGGLGVEGPLLSEEGEAIGEAIAHKLGTHLPGHGDEQTTVTPTPTPTPTGGEPEVGFIGPQQPEPTPNTIYIDNVYLQMRALNQPTNLMFIDMMKRQWFPLAYPNNTFVSYNITSVTSTGAGSEKIWYCRGRLGYR